MESDWLRAACAIAALLIPLGVAWLCVRLQDRRQRRRTARGSDHHVHH